MPTVAYLDYWHGAQEVRRLAFTSWRTLWHAKQFYGEQGYTTRVWSA